MKPFNRSKSLSQTLTRDECDLVIQGAVVLACGGGGPLHFARYILDELYDDDTAMVEAEKNVEHDSWMTMIALVGTPSKVPSREECLSRSASVSSSRRGSCVGAASPVTVGSPSIAQQLASRLEERLVDRPKRRSLRKSVDGPELGSPFLRRKAKESEKPNFYEILKKVQRVKFLTPGGSFDYDDDCGVSPCNAARNTFQYLEKHCQIRSKDPSHYHRFIDFDKFSYILTGELGAVNMATALFLSATHGVAVVDCDGAGRSVPLVNQITYANKFTVSPTAIMSPQPGPDFDSIPSTLLDFPCGTEKMVEEVASALISDENGPFNPYIGYGTYVITGEQMGDVPVFGSYSTALDVGRAMESAIGDERAETVSQVLTSHGRINSIVFHGYVTEKVLQDSKVKDTGYLMITDIDDVENKLKLWYKNEIILAGRPGESPSYMAPDSICLLPAHEEPMDISSIPDPTLTDDRLEVFILVLQADEKIKNELVIKSFESIYKMFKGDERVYYGGEYVPWFKEDTKTDADNVPDEVFPDFDPDSNRDHGLHSVV